MAGLRRRRLRPKATGSETFVTLAELAGCRAGSESEAGARLFVERPSYGTTAGSIQCGATDTARCGAGALCAPARHTATHRLDDDPGADAPSIREMLFSTRMNDASRRYPTGQEWSTAHGHSEKRKFPRLLGRMAAAQCAQAGPLPAWPARIHRCGRAASAWCAWCAWGASAGIATRG